MVTSNRAPSPASSPFDVAVLAQHWNQNVITLLDTQTAWWKETERRTASLIQAWLPPAEGHGHPPEAVQQFWLAWWQLWANALQHDANER